MALLSLAFTACAVGLSLSNNSVKALLFGATIVRFSAVERVERRLGNCEIRPVKVERSGVAASSEVKFIEGVLVEFVMF